MGTLGHRIHGVMDGDDIKNVRFWSHIGSGRIGSGVKVFLLNLTKIDKNETLKETE